MREEMLEYYERELTYLHQMGSEFARKYPKVAGRLLLDPDRMRRSARCPPSGRLRVSCCSRPSQAR